MTGCEDLKVLQKLYWEKRWSISKIARNFHVSPQLIWYRMLKYNIPRRLCSNCVKERYNLSKKLLEELYLKEKKSTLEIARELGVKSHTTILTKLAKHAIQTRTLSEARMKYVKNPFSGDLSERAYMLGLRAGDLSGSRNHKQIRIATSTTRTAQIKMVRDVFGKYGHVGVYPFLNDKGRWEWRVYCDLDRSFSFLLEKPEEIPEWILNNRHAFYSFFAGYMDSEGSWCIRKCGKNSIRFTLRVASTDKIILEQLKDKLEKYSFHLRMYLDKKKQHTSNYGSYNKNLYALWFFQKSDIIRLADELLNLSHHSEKICWMKLILEHKDKECWDEVRMNVSNLRERIKERHRYKK